TSTATPASPPSTSTGHNGSAPSAAPTTTSTASTSARAAPIAPKTPPVVQYRSRAPSNEREKSAIRAASPTRAGSAEFTSDPTPTTPPTTTVRLPPGIEETPTCLIEAATCEIRIEMRRYASVNADPAKFDRVDPSFQTRAS